MALGSREFEDWVWENFNDEATPDVDFYELQPSGDLLVLDEILTRLDMPVVLRNCADKLPGVKLTFPRSGLRLSSIVSDLKDSYRFNVNRYDPHGEGVSNKVFFDKNVFRYVKIIHIMLCFNILDHRSRI